MLSALSLEIGKVLGAAPRPAITPNAERRLRLAGISHELRAALLRLRINVELSEPELHSGTAAAMVRDIKEIDVILSQLLACARPQRGGGTGAPIRPRRDCGCFRVAKSL